MKRLQIEPLTKEAFAPYGDVIETEGRHLYHINNGQVERYHALAKVDISNQEQALISIFRAKPVDVPITIDMLERHPLGSQAIIPINGNPFVVVVAEAGDNIDFETLRVFLTNGFQGVNYHKGVWHFPVLALNSVTDMLVVDRGGENNCDELFFEPMVIENLCLLTEK